MCLVERTVLALACIFTEVANYVSVKCDKLCVGLGFTRTTQRVSLLMLQVDTNTQHSIHVSYK